MERIIKEKDKHGNVTFGSVVYFITFCLYFVLYIFFSLLLAFCHLTY